MMSHVLTYLVVLMQFQLDEPAKVNTITIL